MPPSKSSGRPASGAPGVKMLITAASLAATVGGWAMLSNIQGVSSTSTSTPEPAQLTAALSIKLPPLPTLVPPPDPKTLAINLQPAVVPSNYQPAAAAAPVAAPASQIAGLRVVSAPDAVSGGVSGGGSVAGAPAPATTTHSSKP